VVFVPGLAERIFPQKLREDPILLDALRRELGAELATQGDRAQHERLLLRVAAGAATRRLYLSYSRIELGPLAAELLAVRRHRATVRRHARPPGGVAPFGPRLLRVRAAALRRVPVPVLPLRDLAARPARG